MLVVELEDRLAKTSSLAPNIVAMIKRDMKEKYAFEFSEAQIQRIAREHGIIRALRYWGDTDAREVWQDAMAKKFARVGFWPANSYEVNQRVAEIQGVVCPDETFPIKLRQGYERYRRNSARQLTSH